MEFFIFIALVIIIILLVGLRSKQKEIAQLNDQNFRSLRKELLTIKEKGDPISKKDTPLKATDEEVVQWRPYIAPEQRGKTSQPLTRPEQPTTRQEELLIPATTPVIEKEEIPIMARAAPDALKTASESWQKKWQRNNPDLEKFVGENLVNKIGIAVLVLGIAFFVKYAIDQNWIKEIGRVCIGIGCGIILVGIAHYLRKSYRSFSSVMAGGGVAVFYFTIAFAFHEYQLFSQTAAFVIMVVITAFAVVLALLYNKIELAVIAAVGGFLVPFLVSNGSGNYIVLFSYLLILNIGMLIIAYFKKWPFLHVLSFISTLLIFAGWLLQSTFHNAPLPYKNVLLFASAFYIVFLTTTLINNLRTQKPFNAFDFSLLMLITFSYYAEGMFILSKWDNGAYQGFFTLVLGIINLCLAWWLYKTEKGDRNLLYLLIGLTLTFISLAAPVQLHGHTITLFWSAEAVLLYWLYQRSSIRIFKYSSAIVLALMLISLLMDWSLANEKSHTFLPVIFINWQGILTNIVAIISFFLYSLLLQKEVNNSQYLLEVKNKTAGIFIAIAGIVILYITCILGVNLYFDQQQSFDVPNAYHQLITYLFIAIILLIINRTKIGAKPTLTIGLILAGFIFYISSRSFADNLMAGIVEKEYASSHAYVHWLADACMLYLLFQLITLFRKNMAALGNPSAWLISIILLLFFSIESRCLYVYVLANTANFSTITAQYLKAGLTIVWALFSFVLMWLGMKYKYKTLRIISLTIFSAALLKLFLFDIINISEGGKIAAFIMLGILLLVISFMYQRLKKIIIDDENKTI